MAIAWVLADESVAVPNAVFEQIAQTGCVVPALWWAEVRNVLIVSERRGRITPAGTNAALAAFEELSIRLDHAPNSTTVLELARRYEISAYDAVYLELTVREGRALATLDRRLADAARKAGVEMYPSKNIEAKTSSGANK